MKSYRADYPLETTTIVYATGFVDSVVVPDQMPLTASSLPHQLARYYFPVQRGRRCTVFNRKILLRQLAEQAIVYNGRRQASSEGGGSVSGCDLPLVMGGSMPREFPCAT